MELDMSTVQYIVFDEADRLFEMGFSEQLNELLVRGVVWRVQFTCPLLGVWHVCWPCGTGCMGRFFSLPRSLSLSWHITAGPVHQHCECSCWCSDVHQHVPACTRYIPLPRVLSAYIAFTALRTPNVACPVAWHDFRHGCHLRAKQCCSLPPFRGFLWTLHALVFKTLRWSVWMLTLS